MMNIIGWLTRTRFVSKNARSPGRTFFGAKAAQIMTNANRQTSEDAAARLAVEKQHCVLELGPGSGWAMRSFAAERPARLVGVEISARFRAELAALDLPMEIEIHDADAVDMSGFLQAGSVDRLLAVNVVYFLHPLGTYADELFRVMAPGGRGILACKFELIRTNNDKVFVNKDAQAVVATFEAAGFTVTRESVDLGSRMKSYTAIHISK
jgi:cyclopropane fatty-acyl-phospholipid synthase-like methyltransferase